jgi:hypothetical protein
MPDSTHAQFAAFIQTLPPGEMKQMVCEECGCSQFTLHSETRNSGIDAFHTNCVACGKRGMLVYEATHEVTQKFVQFADPPENSGGITVVTTVEGETTTFSAGSNETPSE